MQTKLYLNTCNTNYFHYDNDIIEDMWTQILNKQIIM